MEKKWTKLKNGQWINLETQQFMNHAPLLEGRTMMTKDGIINVFDYSLFMKSDIQKAVIPAYCGDVKKVKKTTYANFIDFETISIGKRKIDNIWVGFNFNFSPGKAYFLKCEKNDKYLAEIKILDIFEIK